MAFNIERIQPGVNVYGRDEDKIGEVSEVGTNYVLVQKGWLFTTDVYVPFSAISTVSEDRVVLNVSKDEVGELDWSAPPTETYDTTYTTATTSDTSYATADTSSTTADTTYTDTGSTATTRTAAYDTGTVNRGTVDAGEEVAVPIVEEELRVGTRNVERGGVRVDTRVEETPVEEQVTLRDETVHVERRPASDASVADVNAFQEGVFEVRETDQEAIVDKQARVVEEVVISKDVEERTETVRDTVRRTDVDVQETGGLRTTGSTTDVDYTTGSTTTNRDRTLTDRVEGATGLDVDRDADVGGRPQRS